MSDMDELARKYRRDARVFLWVLYVEMAVLVVFAALKMHEFYKAGQALGWWP